MRLNPCFKGTKNWGDKIYIHETVSEISHLGSPHGIKKKDTKLLHDYASSWFTGQGVHS